MTDQKTALHVLAQYQQLQRRSTKKWPAFVETVGEDGRLRGAHQFRGASRTGRDAGRLVQVQNFPRGMLSDPAAWADLMLVGGHPAIEHITPTNVMDILGSTLRAAITASGDRLLVAADLASIESRVLGWLASSTPMLDIFKADKCTYKTFATWYFKKEYDAITKAERSFCKPAVLGCIGEGTLVLTDSGPKPIESVKLQDMVYDGVEFVRHSGAVFQGVKETIEVSGIRITPDHEVLIGEDTWVESKDLQSESISQAIGLASGCLSSLARISGSASAGGAERPTTLTPTTLTPGRPRSALSASAKTGATAPRPHNTASTGETGTDSRIGITPSSVGATPQLLDTTTSTGGAGSSAGLSLCRTSCCTAPPSPDGTTKSSKSTGSITRDTMNGATFGLLPDKGTAPIPGSTSTSTTSEKRTPPQSSTEGSPPSTERAAQCSVKSRPGILPSRSSQTKSSVRVRTHDVLNAGPRQRYMVLTPNGPLIVHNCGYRLSAGVPSRKRRVDGAEKDIPATGLIAYAESMGQNGFTRDQAGAMVKLFRDKFPEVPAMWDWLETATVRCIEGGPGTSVKGYRVTLEMLDDMLTILLPSGRRLWYYKPQIREQVPPWNKDREIPAEWGFRDGKEVVLRWKENPRYGETKPVVMYYGANQSTKGKWTLISTHSGKITEQEDQGYSRDLFFYGMMAYECGLGRDPVEVGPDRADLAKEYVARIRRENLVNTCGIIMRVHDEAVAEAENAAELQRLQNCMAMRPPEADGDLILGSSGFVAKRYRKD